MEINQVLELYPEYSVTVTLFDNVSNMSELKEMLIKGKLEAALVNATMVHKIIHSLNHPNINNLICKTLFIKNFHKKINCSVVIIFVCNHYPYGANS